MTTDTHPLIGLINRRGLKTIAEIGVWHGNTSNRLLTHCPGIDVIYMIDPWQTYESINQLNSSDQTMINKTKNEMDAARNAALRVAAKWPNHTKVLRMLSLNAASQFEDNSLDMAIIDGDHGYEACKADCNAWLAKIRPGGILAGHDYSSGWQSVVKAVDELFGAVFRLPSGYWYIIKGKPLVGRKGCRTCGQKKAQ